MEKHYEAPKLKNLGTIREITKAGIGGNCDGTTIMGSGNGVWDSAAGFCDEPQRS